MITEGHQYRQMSDELLDLHLKHLELVGRSAETVAARRGTLQRLAAALDYGLAFAAQEQIEAFFLSLRRRGRSKATLSIYHYHAHAFYLWACTVGHLDGDPMANMKRPRMPRAIPNPVTEDELERALSLPEPVRTAVILGAFEGMRRGEIAQCKREHITEENTLIPSGKGDKPGVVPTHPFVWQLIRDRPPGLLVADSAGRAMTGNCLSNRARRAFDAAGLPNVHLHRLRHRYGTLIQKLYGDLRVTQECLRHSRVSSTEGYTMVASESRTAAVAALPVPRTTGPADH